MNFEADAYVECVKRLPAREIRLETADATYFHFKTDIFKREITYSTDKSVPANLVTISADRAFEIINMNKNGEKPLQLQADGTKTEKPKGEYSDLLGQDDLTRFDKKKKKKNKNKNQRRDGEQRPKPENNSEKPEEQPQQQAPVNAQPGEQPQQNPHKKQWKRFKNKGFKQNNNPQNGNNETGS